MAKIEGYSGICRQCFCPIKIGDEMQLRPGGPLFHRKCVQEHPDGHYVKLELRKAARQRQKEEAQCTTADQSRAH